MTTEPTKSDFFARIEQLCETKGISVTKLAELIGKAGSNAVGWRKGAIPRNDTLKAIAEYFNVPIRYLTDGAMVVNGIVGNGNKNNSINVGGSNTRQLSELEQELLLTFGKLDTMKKAELLVAAKKLLGE